MEDGLKSMRKIEEELLQSEMKKHIRIIRGKGQHSLEIHFDRRTPKIHSERIKNDINNGLYPGLKIIPIFNRNNLYDLKIVLKALEHECICNMIDIDLDGNDYHLDRSGIAED